MVEERDGFWSSTKIIFVLLFVAGFVVGALITNQFIDPFLSGTQASDQNSLSELNTRIDSRNDELYNCLLENEINPVDCS